MRSGRWISPKDAIVLPPTLITPATPPLGFTGPSKTFHGAGSSIWIPQGGELSRDQPISLDEANSIALSKFIENKNSSDRASLHVGSRLRKPDHYPDYGPDSETLAQHETAALALEFSTKNKRKV